MRRRHQDWQPCRICGHYNDPNLPSEHQRCDEAIAAISRPSIVPSGMSLADYDETRLGEMRRDMGEVTCVAS